MSQALLIFARLPQPGKVKTRLTPYLPSEDAAKLYDCMVRDVLSRTACLGTAGRFLFHDEGRGAEEYFRGFGGGIVLQRQAGKDLGERLVNAFAAVFELGFRTAAVIGTDSPDLPLPFLGEAFDRLERGVADAVFGPTVDGGYYLVALRGPHPELFRGVPWSTGQVLEVSLRRADESGIRISLLPEWYDVDEPEDLERPGLRGPHNGAPLTREFLAELRRQRHCPDST